MIAFGGVETGSMNPKLAPSAAPRAGGIGLAPVPWAIAITTGITMLADAVFEEASERRTPSTMQRALRATTTRASSSLVDGFRRSISSAEASPRQDSSGAREGFSASAHLS